MIKHDFVGPSRAEFVQDKMKDAPRFSLFPVGTRVGNIDEVKIFPRAIAGVLTSFGGTMLDTINSGKVAVTLEKILPSNEYLGKYSLGHTTQFLWTVTLAVVGYAGFSLIEHAINTSNFKQSVKDAVRSEYTGSEN